MVKVIEKLADELGLVKARIAALESEEAQIRQALVDSGQEVIEGELYRVTVSTGDVARVDYKGIVEKLEPSTQMLTAHTSHAERTIVKCVSL
jgi:hypothetical protein